MLKCSLHVKRVFHCNIYGLSSDLHQDFRNKVNLQIVLLLVCKGVYLPCKLKLGMLLQSMRSVVRYYGRHFKNKQPL